MYNNKYEWCSETDTSDKSFLGWIYNRLQRHDSCNTPHMKRLEVLIAKTPGKIKIGCDCSVGDECPQGKRGIQSRCSIWKES